MVLLPKTEIILSKVAGMSSAEWMLLACIFTVGSNTPITDQREEKESGKA